MDRETQSTVLSAGGVSPEPSDAVTEQAVFAHEFRAALAARRTGLRDLSAALGERGLDVGTPLLAAWRSGTFAPAGLEDHRIALALEEILDLSPWHLAGSVDIDATAQRPGDRRSSDFGGHLLAPTREIARTEGGAVKDAVQRARTALGFERSALLRERSVSVVLTLDENGVERHITQETQWMAPQGGVDSFPVVLMTPVPVRSRSRVEPISGCRLGPTYVDLAAGVFATALVMAAPLRQGETVTTVHRTHLPDDVAPDMLYEHRLLCEVERISVGVTFDPQCAPGSWYGYSRTDDEERGRDLTPGGDEVRVSRDDFGPGAVGVRWAW